MIRFMGDKANLLLLAGTMSETMYNEILTLLTAIPDPPQWQYFIGIYDTLYLISISPEFAVQR